IAAATHALPGQVSGPSRPAKSQACLGLRLVQAGHRPRVMRGDLGKALGERLAWTGRGITKEAGVLAGASARAWWPTADRPGCARSDYGCGGQAAHSRDNTLS